jgi:hypothetical protein
MRSTQQEHARLQEAAVRRGLTLSAWLREAAFEKLARESRSSGCQG